ncbi:MAG: DUF2071 domain-containing protein [Terracidiphilus sp.]
MHLEPRSEREFSFYSRRRFSRQPVIFNARYRGLGPTQKTADIRVGSFEYFFTERPCIFSTNRAGEPIRANLHHVSWPLEEAEAEIERNDLATSVGLELARPRAGAALLAASGSVCVAGRACAAGAGCKAGDGSGDADVETVRSS